MVRYANHALKALCEDQGSYVDSSHYRRGEAYCGDLGLFSDRESKADIRASDCPKCAAIWGNEQLVELGGRVALERMEKPLSYCRSSYRLMIDGVHRGYVSCESGWGKGWELRGIGESWNPNKSGKRVSASAARYDLSADATFWPIHFAAKEAMAVAGYQAFLDGDLPTLVEQELAAEEAKAARAERERQAEESRLAREVERQRQEQERQERIALARDALESIKRHDLSNLETAGLAALAALAGVE